MSAESEAYTEAFMKSFMEAYCGELAKRVAVLEEQVAKLSEPVRRTRYLDAQGSIVDRTAPK